MMLHANNTGLANVPASAVAELRAYGICDDDIATAYRLQERQRGAGRPVLPLLVICGIRQPEQAVRHSLGLTAAQLIGARPKPFVRKGSIHITRRPVWAGSVRTGDVAEADFARAISADQRRTWARACYLTFKRGRQLANQLREGQELSAEELRLTRFTRSCRDMMLRLLDEAQYRKGWCIPSYETLMRWTGLGRRAVKYSLDRLRDLGFLEWIRRYIYTADKEHGARSEQTSNLYRCQLPDWIAKMIGLFAPTPDDDRQRRDDGLEQHAAMLAGAGSIERRRMMPDDPAHRAALILAGERSARRAEAEEAGRECNNCTAPHLNLYISR